MVRIFYGQIPGRQIYNACCNNWMYQVALPYRERWWDDEFAELRDLMLAWFTELFEHHTGGHYTKLRTSVLEHGFQNPIIVTAGGLLRREPWMVPPDTTAVYRYVCEQNGGSRLALAQELNMTIPCIINECSGEEEFVELLTVEDVRARFKDKSYSIRIDPHCGLMTNPTNLSHLGRFSIDQNRVAVKLSKDEMRVRAAVWLKDHQL